MNIYRYHASTLDYLGVGWSGTSPLDSNIVLLPVNATLVKPPKFNALTQSCKFIGGGWLVTALAVPLTSASSLVNLSSSGQVAPGNLPGGSTVSIALVAMSAGDFVTITSLGAVLADATTTNVSQGFILIPYEVGDIINVYGEGQINYSLTGLTAGLLYYLDPTSSGKITSTQPDLNFLVQSVGTAINDSSLMFSTSVLPTNLLSALPVITDRENGKRYKIVTVNGVIGTMEA